MKERTRWQTSTVQHATLAQYDSSDLSVTIARDADELMGGGGGG
eukprot:SAG31_NODE_2092_length_6464_cov_3.597172_12_plen_43_part_01